MSVSSESQAWINYELDRDWHARAVRYAPFHGDDGEAGAGGDARDRERKVVFAVHYRTHTKIVDVDDVDEEDLARDPEVVDWERLDGLPDVDARREAGYRAGVHDEGLC